jgi:predicted ATPase
MRDAVRRHDAIMRTTITAHNGHVFKTIGDAFCAAFAQPHDALEAMLDAQRELGAADFRAVDGLKVRAALHTGTADERDADYFGPTVHRVARLLAIAHGGQVIASGTTADLVRGTLAGDVRLLDLGQHRLKDLTRPERVYQLLVPDLQAVFPALRSLDAARHNLPLVLTSFIGREREVAELTALLAHHRLVTLVGSGGVGKTRTALEVGAQLLDAFAEGVWAIELAPLTRGDLIAPTVAKALGLNLGADDDPLANLVAALTAKQMLLIFDNCEHLINAAAGVISAIVGACPRVTVLATSRQALAIAGEELYRMPSLALPPEDARRPAALSDLNRYAALELFAERARAADHRFVIDDAAAEAVAEICRRLDGIPLAIELAAARVTLLTPRQLSRRLDERFRLLTGGRRDTLPRQQTLRALIDWSHDLLDERERVLFRRLAIFAGSFPLEGAVAVGAADGGLDEFDVIDVLGSLVDKSLVQAEPVDDGLRYRLLESTRAYAAERLGDAAERRHCAALRLHYLRDRFVAAMAEVERTDRPGPFIELFSTEIDDVRAALDDALHDDPRSGAELFVALLNAWKNVGVEREGMARCEAFLAVVPPHETRLVARLWDIVRILAEGGKHNARAFEAAGRAVAYARQAADLPTLAWTLAGYSNAAGHAGETERAAAAAIEAEAIPDPSTRLRRIFLQNRAMLSRLRDDLGGSAEAFAALAAMHRTLGNARMERLCLNNLAEVEHARGRTADAIAIARDVLPGFRADADRLSVAGLFANLAGYYVAADDVENASGSAREAIGELAGRDAESPILAFACEHLALAIALRGDAARAALLASFADAIVERHSAQRGFTEQTTHDRLAALLRDALRAEDFDRARSAGAAMDAAAAITLAREEP